MRRASLLVAGGILAATGLLWVIYGGGLGPQAVPAETVVAGPVTRILAVSGRTAPETEVNIIPAVTARARGVPVSEGELVSAGTVLVDLDDSRQQLVIRQALASLDAAVMAQQAAQDAAERAAALGSTISTVTRQTAERALRHAMTEVERLSAALEQAQLGFSDYRISAPISGTILERSVEPGDLVDPSRVLMRLADLGRIHVEVKIDETYAAYLRVGQAVDLQLTGREDVLAGRVSIIGDEVDPATGGVRLAIDFDAPPLVQIGLTTVTNIHVDRAEDALTAPRTALLSGDEGPAVFVVREERAIRTPIAIIDWPADRVQVTRGLSAGDVILLSPEGIEDGDAITPQHGGTGG